MPLRWVHILLIHVVVVSDCNFRAHSGFEAKTSRVRRFRDRRGLGERGVQEQIVNLKLSRCQRFPQGVGARRGLYERPHFLPCQRALAGPAWPRRTLLRHNHQRA
jgi:hypothetical protein